jgi:hypothetical protein
MNDGRVRIEGLGRPYKLGDTRAIMIEGPSREAIEPGKRRGALTAGCCSL